MTTFRSVHEHIHQSAVLRAVGIENERNFRPRIVLDLVLRRTPKPAIRFAWTAFKNLPDNRVIEKAMPLAVLGPVLRVQYPVPTQMSA